MQDVRSKQSLLDLVKNRSANLINETDQSQSSSSWQPINDRIKLLNQRFDKIFHFINDRLEFHKLGFQKLQSMENEFNKFEMWSIQFDLDLNSLVESLIGKVEFHLNSIDDKLNITSNDEVIFDSNNNNDELNIIKKGTNFIQNCSTNVNEFWSATMSKAELSINILVKLIDQLITNHHIRNIDLIQTNKLAHLKQIVYEQNQGKVNKIIEFLEQFDTVYYQLRTILNDWNELLENESKQSIIHGFISEMSSSSLHSDLISHLSYLPNNYLEKQSIINNFQQILARIESNDYSIKANEILNEMINLIGSFKTVFGRTNRLSIIVDWAKKQLDFSNRNQNKLIKQFQQLIDEWVKNSKDQEEFDKLLIEVETELERLNDKFNTDVICLQFNDDVDFEWANADCESIWLKISSIYPQCLDWIIQLIRDLDLLRNLKYQMVMDLGQSIMNSTGSEGRDQINHKLGDLGLKINTLDTKMTHEKNNLNNAISVQLGLMKDRDEMIRWIGEQLGHLELLEKPLEHYNLNMVLDQDRRGQCLRNVFKNASALWIDMIHDHQIKLQSNRVIRNF